ncbi:hypothetical protein PC128_g19927 [Phytophthora cactorum]|nr:hypothetical protein PC120_g18076 [Phytophthora cactorum]KAG3050614.1 hypothetical protein PC121_g18279 [Phytophthora cactorum]KAG3165434.1 hypothetical protein PC128_g19927 [Phytophthora cactorum]KAG4046042.1 hypothetical protein PC123_g18572 [Phytophthora cactorum]
MLGSLWGEGWSVWRAAKKARLDKLEEVLRSEVQPNMVVNRKHPMRGLTPLMAATSATNTTSVAGCVRVLISYGADVNTVDNTKHKNTALHYAACNNKATAIGILLDAGANAFARNVEGFTALDLAWKNGRREAARVLMKHVQLQSGWLNISTKITIPRWKRCWCVILARDSEYSSAELCVFDRPDHLRPDLILQFGSSSMILIPSRSPFEFHVDGVKMQHLGLRSSKVETTANQEVKCCHELAFATDEWKSPNDRRLWLKALRASCAFTTGGRRGSRIKRQLDQSSQRDIGKRINELRPSSPISVGRRSSQE